jgi:hypothetical protein
MYANSDLNSWHYLSSGNHSEDAWPEETIKPKDCKVICRSHGTLPKERHRTAQHLHGLGCRESDLWTEPLPRVVPHINPVSGDTA